MDPEDNNALPHILRLLTLHSSAITFSFSLIGTIYYFVSLKIR